MRLNSNCVSCLLYHGLHGNNYANLTCTDSQEGVGNQALFCPIHYSFRYFNPLRSALPIEDLSSHMLQILHAHLYVRATTSCSLSSTRIPLATHKTERGLYQYKSPQRIWVRRLSLLFNIPFQILFMYQASMLRSNFILAATQIEPCRYACSKFASICEPS